MSDALKFKNLVEMQEKNCDKNADKKFLSTKGANGFEYITFGEFADTVNHFRSGLASLGVTKDDKIGIIANNSEKWAVAAYSTYGLNAQFIPMSENQMPKELEYILNDAKVSTVLCANDKIIDKVNSFKSNVASIRNVIDLEGSENTGQSYDALIKAGKARPIVSLSPDIDDIMGFIYTSGTTGKPKGVKLSHGNIVSNVLAGSSCFDFGTDDSTLSFLPWSHIFGQTVELHLLMLNGMSTSFVEHIDKLLLNLTEVKPTILVAVPRIFENIYSSIKAKMNTAAAPIKYLFYRGMELATKKKLGQPIGVYGRFILSIADRIVFSKVRSRFGGKMKFALSGSAALNIEVANFLDNLGIKVYEGYGLSETSPIVSMNTLKTGAKLGTVGKPAPGVKVVLDKTITGENSKDGEIVVYGPNVMKGYHNMREATAEVMTADGGFKTGDLGSFDDEGYLKITGRLKEQYKLQSGKYVVPSPLEELLKLSVYIDNLYIWGDNKAFNVVIVSLDKPMIAKFASEHGITDTATALCDNDKIKDLIASEIKTYSKDMKDYEVPKKFKIIEDQWTSDNGMVTQSMKLKRKIVEKQYMAEIEKLYE